MHQLLLLLLIIRPQQRCWVWQRYAARAAAAAQV
jgi:hypothetical protein